MDRQSIQLSNQLGQTLIEVVVALSVAAVVASAITVAVLSALNNAEYAKNQNLATQYAQQGEELVRAQRNSDYGTFKTLNGNYCLAKSCTAIASDQTNNTCGPKSGQTCGQNVDLFVREVIFQQPDPANTGCNEFADLVTVKVSWSDNKCTSTSNPFCHTVNLVSCLSDAGVIPTP